jgi:hypothetical protein
VRPPLLQGRLQLAIQADPEAQARQVARADTQADPEAQVVRAAHLRATRARQDRPDPATRARQDRLDPATPGSSSLVTRARLPQECLACRVPRALAPAAR